MKNLYGLPEKVEDKIDDIKSVESVEDVKEVLGFDPYEATLEEIFFKLFEYGFGIPTELWKKKLVDLNEEDIETLDFLEENIVQFTRV